MLRLGYKASAEQFGPRELLDFAVAAEDNGFESVFVSDHFQPWRHSDGHAPFAIAWLAATGGRTKEGALGIPWPDNRERFARLREAVKLIRQLWTEQSVTFDGEYYHTRNATIYDRPAGPIPICVSAGGPQVAKYAGRAGDGLICTSGKGMELYSEQLLPSFEDGAKESGRDASRLDRMIEVKVSYDTDRSRAMEDTKIWAALALPAEAKAGVDDPREMERLARGVEDVAHRRWLVSNDPDEHIEQLKPYLDLGFNHLVFHAPGDDQLRFLKLYGEQILPRLRKQWG